MARCGRCCGRGPGAARGRVRRGREKEKCPLGSRRRSVRRDRAEKVSAAIGQETPLFRFPFIATTPELSEAIHSAGLIDVTVTADGADWTDISPEDAVAQILAMLEQHDRRGMVLLHDPFSKSARRTRLLLQSLKAEGYSVVALEQPEG